MSNAIFHNPTLGNLNLTQVVEEILNFIKQEPEDNYDIIVGTDSKTNEKEGEVDFVTAIVVHRLGKGGRYFWSRLKRNRIYRVWSKIIRTFRKKAEKPK